MSTDARIVPVRSTRTGAATLTLWLLVVAVVLMLLLPLVDPHMPAAIGLIQAAILAVPLFLAARQILGRFITTAVIVALLLTVNSGPIIDDLATPANSLAFAWTLTTLPVMIALAVAAIVAAVEAHQARRRSQSRVA